MKSKVYKKIFLLIILLSMITACSKPQVATLNQGVSKMRSRYHYTLYVPSTPLVHDPVSAITSYKRSYSTWNIYTNSLGKQKGSDVSYLIYDNSVKHFNSSAIFDFTKKAVVIENVQICNVDNECIDGGLDGKFKVVEKAPKREN